MTYVYNLKYILPINNLRTAIKLHGILFFRIIFFSKKVNFLQIDFILMYPYMYVLLVQFQVLTSNLQPKDSYDGS